MRVNGTHFEIEGNPYYFAGTNLWFGANCGSKGEGGNRERLIKELDLLKSLGITNLRLMGASEATTEHNTVNPPIQSALGVYDEEVLEGLDFCLAEMAKRNMYAVIFLNNYWVWTGGMAQYICWFTGEEFANPFTEKYSWYDFVLQSSRFYEHEEANKAYRDYIKMMINRKNTITGVLYKDDPTIMSWQLANEPRPHPDESKTNRFDIMVNWINETAAYIKSLDPHHLVSTGNEGITGCLGSEECYLNSHSGPNIDYMTMHLWVLNWSWYDPLRPQETYPDGEKKAVAYLQDHISYAQQIGKPLTFEEFGIPRDGHSFSPDAPTTYRDRYYKRLFDIVYESAADGSPFAGTNFWSWAGYGRARNPEEAVWRMGDDYVGDPPQEPQGRNSIFSSDATTLEIIQIHASEMQSLCKTSENE